VAVQTRVEENGDMGYPAHLLGKGERIELATRPHWKAMVMPVIVLVITAAAGGFLAALVRNQKQHDIYWIAIAAVAVIVIVWWTIRPWINWANKNYVITNQRLIIREGVIHRDGRDIPLPKVNDVSFHHKSLLDRMLGCGTLVVESAGQHGQIVLDDIPHVEHTQRELTQLIEGAPTDVEIDVPNQPQPGQTKGRRRG
jgi:uncharacterized membrane protein YdbT with pleckstrin-like domain